MKKILFLLLCTVSIYGQTSTGQEQSFPYGIVNESLQTITTPTYIGTFGTDGTQGKIPSAYIAKTADVADSLATKENVANKSNSYTVSSTTTYASTKAIVDGLATKQNTLTNPVTGTGTTNYVPKFTASGTVGNSSIQDSGSLVTIPVRVSQTALGNSNFFGIETGFKDNLAANNYNTAFGNYTLRENISGTLNSAFGANALRNNTGSQNMAFGYQSLGNNTTGSQNCAGGFFALNGNTTGSTNTAIGTLAGRYLADGSTANSTSDFCIFIGNNTKSFEDNAQNQIVIGNLATGLGSNTTVIGNSSTTTARVYGRQLVNTSTDNGADQLQVNGSTKTTALTLSTTPTTSAGTYDILTRNTSTGVVEKKLNADFVHTTGNETISGIKTFNNSPEFKSSEIKINNSDNDGYGSIQLNLDRYLFLNKTGGAQAIIQNTGMALYKSPTILANIFTSDITATRSFYLPNASGTIALVETVKPYKVYTALLSQTGTSAPTATVLENTLGGTIVWSYNSTGTYIGTLTGAFTSNKTAVFITGSFGGYVTNAASTSVNDVTFTTVKSDTGAYTNGVIANTSIEIRVYN